MSIHSPARQAGESQADYRARRESSRAAVRSMRLIGIGDQRKAPSSREKLRDSQRENGKLRGLYGAGILQPQRQRNQKRMEKLHPLRDEHGAYTLTGRSEPLYFTDAFYPAKTVAKWTPGRHVWLAGVSAARGY